MNNICLTPPAPPYTINEAKAIVRSDLDTAEHDALLTQLIAAAHAKVEQDTNRRIGLQTWQASLNHWPRQRYITIPNIPLQTIISVEYSLHAQNEVQTLTINGNPSAGTFTLTYAGETTAPLAHNADATAIAAALGALNNIGANNITVTGTGPFTITFVGALANTNTPLITAANNLTGGTTPTITIVEATPGQPNTPQTPHASTYLTIAYHNTYGRLELVHDVQWPTAQLLHPGLIVTYTCGYITPPADIMEAIASLIAYWYDNPEAAIASTTYKAEVGILPLRYQEIIRAYSQWRR